MRSQRRPAVDRRASKTRFAVASVMVLVGGVAVGACSNDSEITVPAVQPVTVDGTAVDGTDDGGSESGTAAVTTLEPEPNHEEIPETSPPADVTAVAAIPGLDSTSEFCAAWSRFTGSFTLVAPSWAVALDADLTIDVDPAVIEVAASPTMVGSYFDLGTNWPDAIAEYQTEGMDSYRPLFDRMNRSFERLKAAGATEAQLTELADWWEGQLATFEGDSFPSFEMVPTDLQPIVIAAAEKTRTEEVPMVEDPSLVSNGVNAVYDYLATNCPDRGQLAGEGVADNLSTDEP